MRMKVRRSSTAERQRDPDRHEHAAAGLVEAPTNSPKPWIEPVSHAGDQYLSSYFDRSKSSGHDEELDDETSGRIDELRKKSGEKEKRLGIGQRGECALPEQGPACSGPHRTEDFDAYRGRAPDLDAEPHEIGASDPLQH